MNTVIIVEVDVFGYDEASLIIIEKPVNLDNRDEWNNQFDWLIEKAFGSNKRLKSTSECEQHFNEYL